MLYYIFVCSLLCLNEIFSLDAQKRIDLDRAAYHAENFSYEVFPQDRRIVLKWEASNLIGHTPNFYVTYDDENGKKKMLTGLQETVTIQDVNVCEPHRYTICPTTKQPKCITEWFPTRKLIPGSVTNLYVTDEDDGPLLHWSAPRENAACVRHYCVSKNRPGYAFIRSGCTKNLNFTLQSEGICGNHIYMLTIQNEDASFDLKFITYPFVPEHLLRNVFHEKTITGLLLFWNISGYNEACYNLIQVDMCPINNGPCRRYSAKDAVQITNSKLTIYADDLVPEVIYNISISALGKGKPFKFQTKIEQTVSNAINSTTTKERTFDGNTTLIHHIQDILAKLKPNSTYEDGDLSYSSFKRNIPENSTYITLKNQINQDPEVTLLEYAVHQLIDSNITVVVVAEKNKSKDLGDIVTVKTKALQESSNDNVLRIKFDRKTLSKPNHTDWTCVYWNFKISKWSDHGIITEIEPEFIVCLSSHLSTFSILLPDPSQSSFNMKYEDDFWHKVWLTRICRLGSGITLCFLILILTINYGKKTGGETRKILVHSSFALLLTHGIYQIHTFLEGYWEGYSKCLGITVMKYYCVLSFLLWTAADGINMWRILLTDVFNTRGYLFYRWYKIISWGVPLISTSIGLFFNNSPGKCNLQFNKIYDLIFFTVPWIVILGCNMLLFVWILLNITCKNKLGRLKDKTIDYFLALTQVFGIGLCVVFPLLYFESTQLLGEYLLAGVISTQGLLICIVRGGIFNRTGKKSKRGSSRTTSSFRTDTLKSSTRSTFLTSQKNIPKVEFDTKPGFDTMPHFIILRVN